MPGIRKGGTYTFRIVPSGYEFLGPGNKISYNVPRNYNDVIAKEHDIAYRDLIERGINPYYTFTTADEDFLSKLEPDDIPSFAAKYIFKSKHALGDWGILPVGTFIIQYATFAQTRPSRVKGPRMVTQK